VSRRQKLREKPNVITMQRGAIEQKLARTDDHLRAGAEKPLAYIDPLEQPGALFAEAPTRLGESSFSPSSIT